MDVALALAAAFFFALGLVLQEKAASEQPDETVAAGFLVRLARQPVWLLGLAMQGVGFVAQAIALGVGRMVVVQPLLVATIVFALPLGRLIEKRSILRSEWIGAAMVTGGLAALLIASKPAAGDDEASAGAPAPRQVAATDSTDRHNLVDSTDRHNLTDSTDRHNLADSTDRHNLADSTDRHNVLGGEEPHRHA